MNQADFLTNLIEYSKENGFSFLVQENFEGAVKPSAAKLALIKVAYGAAFGLVGVLSSGNAGRSTTENMVADLKRMNEYCDLVGIKVNAGNVIIRMAIDGDDFQSESLLGRFALIHERVFDFRKYATSVLASKTPTLAQVVVAFSEHKRANDFNRNFAGKCKHSSIWKNVHTHPWIADLEGEAITRLRAPLDQLFKRDDEKVSAALFRKRQ